jgi:hypothetical protein
VADTIAEVVVQLETELADAQQQLVELGDAVQGIGGAAEEVAAQLDLFNEAMMVPYADATGQLNLFAEELEPIAAEAENAARGIEEMHQATSHYSDAAKKIIEEQEEIEQKLEKAKEALDEISVAYYKGALSAETFARAQRQVESLEAAAKGGGGEGPLGELGKIALGLAGIELGIGMVEKLAESFKEMAEEAVKSYAEVERLGEALTFMTGNAAEAAESIERVQAQATRLGVGLEPAQKMLQELTLYGHEAGEITTLITDAANAAAASGHSFEMTSNALLRIVETGNVSPRILKQLGVSAKDLAAVMGVSATEIQKAFRMLPEAMQVEVIDAAMAKTRGAAEKTKDDLLASWTRMKDEGHRLLETIGKDLSGVAKSAADAGSALAYAARYAFTDWQKLAWVIAGVAEASLLMATFDYAGAMASIAKLGERLGEAKVKEEEAAKATEKHGDTVKETKAALEAAGFYYEQHAKAIEASAKAQESAVNIEKIANGLRKATGEITAQEAVARELDAAKQIHEIKAKAIQEELALPKPAAQADKINQGLHAKILEEDNRYNEEKARIAAKGTEEEFRTVAKLNQEKIAAEEKHSEAMLAMERTGIDEQLKMQEISAEERADLMTDLENRELMQKLDFINKKYQADIDGGMEERVARQKADAAIEAEYDGHAEKMIAIANQLSAHLKAVADDERKAQEAAMDGVLNRAKSEQESRKRIASTLAGAHLMTQQDKVTIERDADAKINTLDLQLLSAKLQRLAVLQNEEHTHAKEIMDVTNQVAALQQRAASQEEARLAELAAARDRTLGITSYEALKNELIDIENELIKFAASGTAALGDLAEATENWLQKEIQAAEKIGAPTGALRAQLAVLREVDEARKDMQAGWGPLAESMIRTFDTMFSKFASGFAQAITAGKNFGQTMMSVLKQLEQEILTNLIGFGLNKLKDLLVGLASGSGGLAGMLGKVMGAATGGAGGAAAAAPQVAALSANTAADTALGVQIDVLSAGVIALQAAVDLNTTALWATGFIPGFQEGGQVMRSGVAVVHAGETIAGKNIMQNVGESLNAQATGGGTQIISFDGATFHGVPDQRYVSSIMNSAVRSLRQSSRTWAFNPTGQ